MKNPNLRKKRGQNTAEYILMLVLVAGSAIVAFKAFGTSIMDRFNVVMANMAGQEYKNANTATVIGDQMTTWDISHANKVGATNPGAATASGTPAGGTPPSN